ncbi:hypothetical protein CRUP_019818 [Coryphaenoides rupestris]|nr:hypothetical protein CRUP_019818 [Coryphaenoides rupestris]
MRITLQTLLTLVVVALAAVAKMNSFHPQQDGLEDVWYGLDDGQLIKTFNGGYWDDGEFVEGDAVVEVVDSDATDLLAVLEEKEVEEEMVEDEEVEEEEAKEEEEEEVEEDEEAVAPRLKQGALLKPRACNRTFTGKAQNCAVTAGEMFSCGTAEITSEECKLMGCCVDSITSVCHYPMDECTVDEHIIFAIRSTSGSIDLNRLAIPGQPKCIPIILTPMVAIYKFSLTECGTRTYEVSNTMIYMVEVHTVVDALNLKFMIECRYAKAGSDGLVLATVGFQVKSPLTSFPSIVINQGLYVYLELNLISARRTSGVLVVNYCLAFPRNARNALVLIYEGCANPNDKTVSVMSVRGNPANTWQRRFMVHAFQFMNVSTKTYLDEPSPN